MQNEALGTQTATVYEVAICRLHTVAQEDVYGPAVKLFVNDLTNKQLKTENEYCNYYYISREKRC